MNRKVDKLTERVERLKPANPENEGTVRRMKRILGTLDEDEQISLAHLIHDAEEAGQDPDDEAWLSTRPQKQQDIFRKVTPLFREQENLR